MAEVETMLTSAVPEVLIEAELSFVDNDQIGTGRCSCVCINDERCCGCILQ
jgi:hypothetical protein